MKRKSISSLAKARRPQNAYLTIDDPFKATETEIADIYLFWSRKYDNLKPNDHKNRILVKGILSSLISVYDLIDLTRSSLLSQGRPLRQAKKGRRASPPSGS